MGKPKWTFWPTYFSSHSLCKLPVMTERNTKWQTCTYPSPCPCMHTCALAAHTLWTNRGRDTSLLSHFIYSRWGTTAILPTSDSKELELDQHSHHTPSANQPQMWRLSQDPGVESPGREFPNSSEAWVLGSPQPLHRPPTPHIHPPNTALNNSAGIGRSTPSRAQSTVLNCTYSKMILGSVIWCLHHTGSSWPSGAPKQRAMASCPLGRGWDPHMRDQCLTGKFQNNAISVVRWCRCWGFRAFMPEPGRLLWDLKLGWGETSGFQGTRGWRTQSTEICLISVGREGLFLATREETRALPGVREEVEEEGSLKRLRCFLIPPWGGGLVPTSHWNCRR